MKIGCTCGFIGVCGVFAFIAQLVGIIIPKVLVLEIMLHRDRNITLGKFIETVHMEAEEESSDEDDILEIESLTRDDMEYMHNIEKLVLKERNKENGQGTNNETKRKHTTKRNLNRKIENVTNIQNDISNENDMAKDNSTVRAGKTLCKDSSDETSSSSEEEDEEEEENEEEGEEKDGKDQNEDEEEEGKAKYEDENKGEREEEEEEEGDDDDDDDDDNDDDDSSSSSSSSCGESSESVEEETESHASYSSISIGLWNSYICTKDGTNQTECASMSFPDALHILKKDARGFIEADFDLSMWHKVKLECIFSLVSCVLGLAFLVASVTKHFERRQLVALVLGSFGFVSSGVFTLVPVLRMMIVSIDAFKSNSEVTQTVKMGLSSSLVAFSVCGVFSMIAAFALISVTWYDRKHKWRLFVRMTKQFDTDLNDRLNDANIAKVYSDPERVESIYNDGRSSPMNLTKHKSDEDHGESDDEQNAKDSLLGTRCVETIEIELTDMSERETIL